MSGPAAAAQHFIGEAEAMAVDAPLPNTPTQAPAAADATGLDGGSLPAAAGQSGSAGSSMPTPTLQEMMGIMTGILQMMADDKKKNAHWMASAKLDEKYFRSITKFDNTKSSWKEWHRHFLNAVRFVCGPYRRLREARWSA